MAKEYSWQLPAVRQLALTKNSCTRRAPVFHTRREMFFLPPPGAEALLLLVVLGAAVYDLSLIHISTFQWAGIHWSTAILVGRLLWFGVAAGFALLAGALFHRFDPSRERLSLIHI